MNFLFSARHQQKFTFYDKLFLWNFSPFAPEQQLDTEAHLLPFPLSRRFPLRSNHYGRCKCLVQRYPLIDRHINKDLIHAHPNPTEQKTPCWTDLPTQSTLPPLCNNKFRFIRANMFARLQPEGPGCCNMLLKQCMDSYMLQFEGKGCMPRGQHACI